MFSPLAFTLATLQVLPVGFITGSPDVPASALRDGDGVPCQDGSGNFILPGDDVLGAPINALRGGNELPYRDADDAYILTS